MNPAAVDALPLALQGAVAALLLVGLAFALVGSFALLRLPDFFRRLHGPSKATTLGVGCVMAASALASAWIGAEGAGGGRELLVLLFLFTTAPVSAHLLVQAALHDDPALRPAPPAALTHAPVPAAAVPPTPPAPVPPAPPAG